MPDPQVLQAEALAALYVPAAQATQTLAPAPLEYPPEQLMHTDAPLEPYDPAKQFTQAVAIWVETFVPATQLVHDAALAALASVPAAQLVQLTAPEKLHVPIAQEVHADKELDPAYGFAAQETQIEAAAAE